MLKFFSVVLLTLTFSLAWGTDCAEKEIQPLLTPLRPNSGITIDSLRYEVAPEPWTEGDGAHRVVFTAPAGERVVLNFPWRRHDLQPENHALIIRNMRTGKSVEHLQRLRVDNEMCSLAFGPVHESDTFALYFLAYTPYRHHGYFGGHYLLPKDETTTPFPAGTALAADVPKATICAVQCRLPYDSFYPMEICATAAERQRYTRAHNKPYYVFAEDRLHPVKMLDAVPAHWLQRAQTDAFSGECLRDEYYCFQIALWTPSRILNQVNVQFSPLKSDDGAQIPADALTCFNTGGVDAHGHVFKKELNLAQGAVMPLWIGVDVARNTAPGIYRGTVTLVSDGLASRRIDLTLRVLPDIILDRGDRQPERMTRLRWLNSARFISDEAVAPYMNTKKESINGKTRYTFATQNGFTRTALIDKTSKELEQITAGGHPLLNAPIALKFETRDAYSLQQHVEPSFEGRLLFRTTLTAQSKVLTLDSVRLELPFSRSSTPYMTGMGFNARTVPETFTGFWEREKVQRWPFDSFWMGAAEVGAHVELRGGRYHGPMLNLYRYPPPESWYNKGQGHFRIQSDAERHLVTVFSGRHTLKKGEKITFEWSILLTPVKPFDLKDQITQRYFHGNPNDASAERRAGIKIVNVHHANEFNPIINYPFITPQIIRGYTAARHAEGLKVKLYYTVRELTSALPEFWALRALGDEILPGGNGGGAPYLREHVVSNYTPQWYAPMPDALGLTADAALLTAAHDNSRWLNYYVEGLYYMVKHYAIDGIYMDDVTFGRDVLVRMRRAMESVKSGCLIDLHSNTSFSIGAANQYAEFFPFVDKLWFGEWFEYEKMSPEEYLVDCSGIVFGLGADMLQNQGNRFLGALYAMTCRYPNGKSTPASPLPMWQFMDHYGLADARLIGYWDEACPVRATHENVRVSVFETDTAYILVAGNFGTDETTFSLIWQNTAVEHEMSVTLPEIENFQAADTVDSVKGPFNVPAKQARIYIAAKKRPIFEKK